MLEILREILSEQFSVEPEFITEATSFAEDLGADSLDFVELAMTLEEEYDISDEEEQEMMKLKTVGEVIDFIKSHFEE